MKIARTSHPSVSLGDNVYVFAGVNGDGSIECLAIKKRQPWSIVHEPCQLTNIWNPAVAVLNEKTIFVFGGFSNNSFATNGYLLDTESKSVK